MDAVPHTISCNIPHLPWNSGTGASNGSCVCQRRQGHVIWVRDEEGAFGVGARCGIIPFGTFLFPGLSTVAEKSRHLSGYYLWTITAAIVPGRATQEILT
jgi:hypothetical protein